MNFDEHKPIYLQIADNLCDRIMRGEWNEEERIPSVRELGMELGVNPNTVMRTYDYLQSQHVIYNKRGIGYFVSHDAQVNVTNAKKAEFVENELAQIFNTMKLLDISINEMSDRYQDFCKKYDKVK